MLAEGGGNVPFRGSSGAILAAGKGYWGALSWSAMMSLARLVRSSFSLGGNRISPLTHRLIIPGCDLGDAHLLTPQCDGNASRNLNRLLALFDGYYGWGRRNEGAICLFNDGASPLGEVFLEGARKPDISADPVLPLDSEVSGDEYLLTTNHRRDAASDDPNRPFGKTRWIFSVSSFLPSSWRKPLDGFPKQNCYPSGPCIKLSPIEPILQHRCATPNPLKTRPGPECCKTAPLRNPDAPGAI